MSTVPLHLSWSNTGSAIVTSTYSVMHNCRDKVCIWVWSALKRTTKYALSLITHLTYGSPISSSDICLYLCYRNFEIYVLLWVCRCLRIIFNSETAAAWWENCTKAESSLLTACNGFAENLRLSTCSQKVAVNNQHFFVSRYIIANREMKPCDLNYAAWIDELAALLVHIPKFY